MDARIDGRVGGGFNPPVPTERGGPDYGRFVDAVRTLQDLTRGADAPDDVVTAAADLLARADLVYAVPSASWTYSSQAGFVTDAVGASNHQRASHGPAEP